MAENPSARRRPECTRCGSRGGPGHYCTRGIRLPAWMRGERYGLQGMSVGRFGSSGRRTWTMYWTWRGDTYEFRLAPRLGVLRNVSASARMEAAEQERDP